MGMGTVLQSQVADLLGGTAIAWTPPATLCFALSTAVYDPAVTGSTVTEPAGNGYARAELANNATTFPSGRNDTDGTGYWAVKTVAVAVVFPAATGSWGTVRSVYIFDAVTGGMQVCGVDLAVARTPAAGDIPQFSADTLTFPMR